MFGDEGKPEMCSFHSGEFGSHGLTDLDPEDEKAMQAEIKEKFKPLLSWLKIQTGDVVRDGSQLVYLSLPYISDLLRSSRYL